MERIPFVLKGLKPVRAFDGKEKDTAMALKAAYESLPTPPATPGAPLAAAASWSTGPNDGTDRISSLPNRILRNIVSRLPAKDAVRTGVLASRWRALWRSVPLVFSDVHLVLGCRENPLWRPGLEGTYGVYNAVSDILATHRGPFRCFQVTCCYQDMDREKIQQWLELIAKKGVEELAFINRPWPLHVPLPATLFSCASLTRLHIGAWKFPNTTPLPKATSFPHLKELFLSLIVIKDRDIVFLLDRSPVLEVLTIISSQTDVRLCLISHSLRCLQLGLSSVGDITVANAPHLERLLMWMTHRRRTGGNNLSMIKIVKAPNLSMLGYWHPGQHQLQIGSTIIKTGTEVTQSTIIPSVEILALDVHFEISNEVKTVPAFLKCFPNIKTLHIKSLKTDKPSPSIVNLKFWRKACHGKCVQHVKKLVIHEFQGKRNEHEFIKFMVETVQALEKVVIILCPQFFSSENGYDGEMKPFTAKYANRNLKLMYFKPESYPTPWSFRMAVDVSCRDPFDLDNTMLTC